MTDINHIAKEASERAAKNAGVAPELLFAPILWVLQDSVKEAQRDLVLAGERLSRRRRMTMLNSIDRALMDDEVANYFRALDGVWEAQRFANCEACQPEATGMKLEILEPSTREAGAILVCDQDHNDIAEFYHNEHATVGQSYETALMLAQKLVGR